MIRGPSTSDSTTASTAAGRAKPAIAREDDRADNALARFDEARGLARRAAEHDQATAAATDDLAWRLVREADPVRVSYVQQRLDLSGPTIRAWAQSGVLEDFGGSPQRIGLESVARVRQHLQVLREAGRDRDLMAAVMSALEFDELRRDDRFRLAVEQMRRGERA